MAAISFHSLNRLKVSESEAPVAGVCDLSCVCVCAQGGLVDNIEQRVQEAQDYVEKAKDFIPKCKKFKKTGKRVRRDTSRRSAQLTLCCCFSPLFLPPLLSSPWPPHPLSFHQPFFMCPPLPALLLSSAPPLSFSRSSSGVPPPPTNLLLGGNDRPHRVQRGALGRLCGEGSVRH